MELENTISLLKEAYPVEEARELLMALVTGTTRFHSINNMRSWERTGEMDKSSEKKIRELQELREDILEMFKGVDGKHLSVEINAKITVNTKNR